MPDRTTNGIICDANVLIHYFEADRDIFRLVARNIGEISVPLPVLDEEVEQINIDQAEELGLTIIEPDDDLIIRIGPQGGGLSRKDRLIMELAYNEGLTCWTSDSTLKRKCELKGISTCWGLEMMIWLCEDGHLDKRSAKSIALKIREDDPHYINEDVIGRFLSRLKEV